MFSGPEFHAAVLSNSAKYCECLSERPVTTVAGAPDFTITAHACTHFRFAEAEHPLHPQTPAGHRAGAAGSHSTEITVTLAPVIAVDGGQLC